MSIHPIWTSLVPDSKALAQFMLWTSVRIDLAALAGLLCLVLFRKTSAATRHLVCALSLGTMLLMPLLALSSPPFGLEMSLPALSSVSMASARAVNVSSVSLNPQVTFVLALAWAGGALLLLLRSLLGFQLIARELGASARCDEQEWHDDLRNLSRQLGLGPSQVKLRRAAVASPMTCGLLRAKILLPQAAQRWDSFRRRAILLHELAHVRRHDVLINQLANVACAMFWFNPMVWIIDARLHREQELACDDVVLQAGVPPAPYAALLLDSSRGSASHFLFGCPMASGARILKVRFAHLLDSRQNRGINRTLAALLGAGFAAVLVLLSAVHPIQAEDIYDAGGDVTAPRIVAHSEPAYPEEAQRAGIEGEVTLALVVGADGSAHDIRVTKSLEASLDKNAIAAVSSWRFRPGSRMGKPVAVRATVQVEFRLK
jgi:TonB family protein